MTKRNTTSIALSKKSLALMKFIGAEKLSKAMGVNINSVLNWMRDGKIPEAQMLLMARALGVKEDTFHPGYTTMADKRADAALKDVYS